MDKIEKQLQELVLKAIEVAEKTGEFAIEQAPLLLKEFYTWHITESIFMVFIYLFSIWFIGIVSKKIGLKNLDTINESEKIDYALKPCGYYFRKDYSYSNDSDSYFFYKVINILKWLLLIGVFQWLYELIFILIAPKLYLIEYFIN